MSRSPLLLAVTWLFISFSAVLAGLAIRLAPIEKAFAWPSLAIWPLASNWTGPLALAVSVVAVLLLLVFTKTAAEGNRARPFSELVLYYPMLFGFVWFLLPAGPLGVRDWIIAAVLALVAFWFARHNPKSIPEIPWTPRPITWITDASLILAPAIVGLLLGHTFDHKAILWSLLFYPFYAFIQLLVFLVVPQTRLRALGLSSTPCIIIGALVFTLVHWPNPLVMLVTLIGMLIWAHQFQKGRPLWQLALVMGLTATTFSQLLPDDLTRHVRVGPGYVRSEAVVYLATEATANGPADPATFIRKVYPETVGREVKDEELKIWLNLLDEARRSSWAHIFLVSSEHCDGLINTGQPLPPPPEIHWTAWPQEWKQKILHFADDEYWQNSGATLNGFAQSLYADILNRSASSEELASWSTALSIGQCKRISEVLLDQAMTHGQQDFTGMSVEKLRLWN